MCLKTIQNLVFVESSLSLEKKLRLEKKEISSYYYTTLAIARKCKHVKLA